MDNMEQVVTELVAKVRGLEMAVQAMQAGGGSPQSSVANQPGGGASKPIGMFSFDKLELEWADKTVTRDPKFWKGESYKGRKYSECPVDYLKKLADEFAYKARAGRAENPPRVQNNGKPWYEQDEFNAKLVNTWANRPQNAATTGPVPGLDDDTNDDFPPALSDV